MGEVETLEQCFAPSLARAHDAMAFVEALTGEAHASAREDLLIRQMSETTLNDACTPPSSSGRPLAALSLIEWPSVCSQPPQPPCRRDTPCSGWCGEILANEGMLATSGLQCWSPSLPASPSIAIEARTIEALDLASIGYRGTRLRRSMSLGAGWSRGSRCDAQEMNGFKGIEKQRRGFSKMRTRALGSSAIPRALPRVRRGLPLRQCSEPGGTPRFRSRNALSESSLAARFGDGCALQAIPEERSL